MHGVFTGIVASSQAVSGFSPESITGLHVWYKADSLALTDGDPVVSLPDSSGNGFDGVSGSGVTYHTGVVSSLPAVRFPGSASSITVPNFFSTLTAAHIFCVLTKDVQNDSSHWHNWNGGATGHYAFGDGHIYDGTGNTTRPDCGIPIISLTSWHLYEVSVGGGDWTLRLNGGTQYAMVGGVTATWTFPAFIGISGYGGGFVGNIAEILVYDSSLGSTDRVNVENYLLSKYGI